MGPILVEEGLGPDGPELVAELEAVRQVGDGAPDGFELPDFGLFAGEGGEVFVTYLGSETEADNAIGAYSIDLATGRLLQGRILFASTEDAEPGESVAVRVKEGQALGLFIVPDVDTLGLDLSAFEDGGLRFSNMLGGRATIGDELAPLLKGDGQVLPIQALHALGAIQPGVNFLNPAAAQQAVFDPVAMTLGFEDGRITDETYDGDFDDVLVGLDGLALPELQVATDAPLV